MTNQRRKSDGAHEFVNRLAFARCGSHRDPDRFYPGGLALEAVPDDQLHVEPASHSRRWSGDGTFVSKAVTCHF